MEDSRETTFREIQKIVDSCIAHDYDRMTNALVLKREYLTVPQLKEYLRQEVFRVTEEIVVMRQTYHALRSIRMDMDTPDFLWESSFFEDLISDIQQALSKLCSIYMLNSTDAKMIKNIITEKFSL